MPITSMAAPGLGSSSSHPAWVSLEASGSDHSSAPLASKAKPTPYLVQLKSPDRPLPSPTQVPGDKAAWRPNGVQKQPWACSPTWLGLFFFFVPGKPPYLPNSAILRLSRVVKAPVVFLTDSLIRRLSLALFLTLTVGHHKGISTGCSVGSVGHQGICCSRTTLTFKMQVGDFLPASFLPCPSSPVCRPTDPTTALRGKKLMGRVLTGTSISTKAEGEDGTEKAALRGKSSIACKSTRDLTPEQATRRQEKGDLGGRHPCHKMENCRGKQQSRLLGRDVPVRAEQSPLGTPRMPQRRPRQPGGGGWQQEDHQQAEIQRNKVSKSTSGVVLL